MLLLMMILFLFFGLMPNYLKSMRKERWLNAVTTTGLPNFSSKLMRDYSMLPDTKLFFEMLSLYDATPHLFKGELSR